MMRKEERAGEKSNFSITCSLLSQYLKEKGSFGKLGLEMAAPRPLDQQLVKGKLRAPPPTMTLLPGTYVTDDDERGEDGAADGGALKSMDLFPQHAGFGSPVNTLSAEESRKTSDAKEVERAELTIFYGGKVLVFDNFPSDKAMDLIQSCGVSVTPPAPDPVTVPAAPVPAVPEISSRPALFGLASASQRPPAAAAVLESGQLAKSAEASASDMPIARRNSLHRFLEKRKDRIITKAPYEVHGGSPAESKPESSKGGRLTEGKPESSKGWLELGRQEDSNPETSSGSSR